MLAVVGAGPRGAAVVARLLAHLAVAPGARAEIHVVDPHTPGAGRVWDPDQSGLLLMNTLAAHATAHPDPGAGLHGPAAPGPTLRQWAAEHAPGLAPHAYPPRALMGRYLAWAHRRAVAEAPPGVRVVHHRTRALDVARTAEGRLRLTLAAGPPLTVDALALATGHTDRRPSPEAARLGAHAERWGLVHLPPGHAQERDTAGLPAGGHVVVRGMAMGFFDQLALLTEGRGGRFVAADAADGGTEVTATAARRAKGTGPLRYLPSGREPRLSVTSGRGVPYLARGQAPGTMPPGHTLSVLDATALARLTSAAPGSLSFRRAVWPLIAKEAGLAWYRTLVRYRPERVAMPADAFLDRYAATAYGSPPERALLAVAVPEPSDRFVPARIDRPLAGRVFGDPASLDAWMREWLADDLAQALRPETSPLKAAAAAVAAAKGPVRRIATSGVLDADSARDLAWFRSFGAHLASGPPASRIAELLALAEAGVVEFPGAGPVVLPAGGEERTPTGQGAGDEGVFVVRTASLPGRAITTRALVDAWLPATYLAHSADPLLRGLLRSGLGRAHRAGPAQDGEPTGALDVTLPELRVRDASGRPAADLFALGVPLEGLEWNTAIGARAGTDAPLFRQADQVAVGMLGALRPAAPS